MKHFLLLFLIISNYGWSEQALSSATTTCDSEVEKVRSQAERFVLALNVDRVKMLSHLRQNVIEEGAERSQVALDNELFVSIMEVLIKSNPKSDSVKNIVEVINTFKVYPLLVSVQKITELNTELSRLEVDRIQQTQ